MVRLSLNGSWTLHAAGSDQRYPAMVPGEVHTALLRCGVITDPFFRENEVDLLWVGEQMWVYERTFVVEEGLLALPSLRMVCDGLDTLASVRLNGTLLGETRNMFRGYEWEVKDLLLEGENQLQITFASPLPRMREAQARRPLFQTRHVPWETDGRGYLRKQQCNFGWDWGPVCVTAGICGDIAMVADHGLRLHPPRLDQQHHADGSVTVKVHACGSGADIRAPLSLRAQLWDGETMVCEGSATTSRSANGAFQSCLVLEVKNPVLWWPNGIGEPHLYRFQLELIDTTGKVADVYEMPYGLRTIALIREPDQWGESFVFAVNGQRFFAKGANWIPGDAFLSRATPQRIDSLLDSMVAAHMNMVRVWGGGIYESAHFYAACASRGLLVWQDFMFACTAYPLEDTAFLDDVYEEIRYQIRRLRNETAIALWCGNNELQSFGTGDAPDRMSWENYEKFFHHDVAAIVAEEDPSRAYWPCSPHSPGFELKDDNNPASGDAHLWAVWHGLEPFEWYRTAFHRFCSEFGFQSYPEPKTIAAITTPADRNITHPVMEHHQRSSAGNAKILHYMLSWFRMPAGFEQTLWLSQLQQGLAIQYAVHHWRRNWPRCAGALYWQLNDTWPAATWSSIDYFGRWKALHYFAKRFFAPIVISGVEAGSSVHLHVSCDHIEPRDAVLDWLVTDLNGATHSEGTLPVRLQPHASQHVQSLDLSDAVMALGERNLLLWLTLSDANAILAEEMLSLVRPKALALQPPELDWHLQQHDGRARLAVTTKRPALWMWITCADADPIWSDNFVCLRPGRSYFFNCMPDATNPTAPNPHSIQLRSLIDLSEPKPNLPKQC